MYNLLGQKIRTLVNSEKSEGEYNVVWDGKDDSGASVSSGVYFYQLTSQGEVKYRNKMLLVK